MTLGHFGIDVFNSMGPVLLAFLKEPLGLSAALVGLGVGVYQFLAGATQPLSRRYAHHFELPNSAGVRVESLERGGPGARAGLEAGDLIVAFDGVEINGVDDLHRALTAERIGRRANLVVLRRTNRLEIPIEPEEMR